MPSIAPTVLEAVNKIGSMINGPLFALICIATLITEVDEASALVGFWIGALSNLALAIFLPEVSWLWWNVSGFLISALVFVIISRSRGVLVAYHISGDSVFGSLLKLEHKNIFNRRYQLLLLSMFVIILSVCCYLDTL